MCNQWQLGNYSQLHQLHKLVEHLLRSSQKKVEWSQYLVEWSGVELVEVFVYFSVEWSQI